MRWCAAGVARCSVERGGSAPVARRRGRDAAWHGCESAGVTWRWAHGEALFVPPGADKEAYVLSAATGGGGARGGSARLMVLWTVTRKKFLLVNLQENDFHGVGNFKKNTSNCN